jgi:hypothetical protein
LTLANDTVGTGFRLQMLTDEINISERALEVTGVISGTGNAAQEITATHDV